MIFLERNLISKVILPYTSALCHAVFWIRHSEHQASFSSSLNLRAHAFRFNSKESVWRHSCSDTMDVSKCTLSQLSTITPVLEHLQCFLLTANTLSVKALLSLSFHINYHSGFPFVAGTFAGASRMLAKPWNYVRTRRRAVLGTPACPPDLPRQIFITFIALSWRRVRSS